jgi:small subunit ribosomal protein S17
MATNKEKIQASEVKCRQFEGVVVGAKAQKTISVLVETQKMHQKYKKHYAISKKYAVHDEKELAKEGDTVLFEECRPMSKTKRSRIVRVIKTA